MISEAELAQMKAQVEIVPDDGMPYTILYYHDVSRLIREVEELRAALRLIIKTYAYEPYADFEDAIKQARAALGTADE